MILASSFTLLSGSWLVPATGALLASSACVLWSYRRLGSRSSIAAPLLKILGLAGLLFCLLEPAWTGPRAKPGANLLALVADNSQSMTLHDRDSTEPRSDSLRRLLINPQQAWRTRLADQFEVHPYLADIRLQPTEDFHDLDFSGRNSSLGSALQQLSERHRGQPLAGALLFTDGQASDADLLSSLEGLPPIYPVLFGGDGPTRDLALGTPSVSQTAFEDAPVTIQAEISARGFEGEEVLAQLFPLEKPTAGAKSAPLKPVAEQTLALPTGSSKLQCRFELRAPQSGVSFYRLTIAAKKPGPAEATLINNECTICVDRGAGPYRILYLSGRPNWEFKFLRRSIETDSQTQLVGLIRIAKREPKFAFRGRAGESSNPLFRGFGQQSKEDTERYDQPVLVRLNTEDDSELRDGFPKTAEDLFKFRAVIIDDLEAEFFTPPQMTLLQRFVSERGGSLLALGGMESFREGQFARSPIGDMLPLYLDQKSEPPPQKKLHLALTREGWLQPWVRLRSHESEERSRLSALPEFDILNQTGAPKPSAPVLASVSDGQRQFPALITQRFGRGRTAALLIGDLWQSGLGDPAQQADLGKAWRQMVRWAVADVPDPLELRIESKSNHVLIQVRLRDKAFLPRDNAQVSLKVTPTAETQSVTLTAEPSVDEPGLYQASYLPHESGGFRIDASALDESGALLATSSSGWASNLGSTEFASLKPNLALMEELAKKTGGQVIPISELTRFAEDLPSKPAPIIETWTQPLWHTPWMFLFALAAFLAEWALRRWKALP